MSSSSSGVQVIVSKSVQLTLYLLNVVNDGETVGRPQNSEIHSQNVQAHNLVLVMNCIYLAKPQQFPSSSLQGNTEVIQGWTQQSLQKTHSLTSTTSPLLLESDTTPLI